MPPNDLSIPKPMEPQRGQETGRSLPPLVISGLVVSKADLITALTAYVPHLADVAQLDDDRFILGIVAHHPTSNGAQHG